MIWIPQRTRRPNNRLRSALVLASCVLLFGGLNLWLIQQGYSSDFDQLRWSKVLTTLDDKEFRIEHVSLLYPHGPIYLLALLHGTLGIGGVITSAWLSTLSMCVLFVLWNRHLRQKGYPFHPRLLIMALLALHPFTLWAASSGLNNALSLLLFYLFCYACYLIISIYDLRAMIMASGLLTALFFADERAIFLFFALLPLIPLLAPPRIANSLGGLYAILAFPLVVAVAGWIYLNWVFHKNPWIFLQAPEASFRGALEGAQTYSWLAQYGGQWLMPALAAILCAAIAFPLPAWQAWKYRRHHRQVGASLALFLHPAVAISIATMAFFLEDLTSLLYLLVAATMGIILLMPRACNFGLMLTLLALGNLGGWAVMGWHPSSHNLAWQEALSARPRTEQANPMQQLGLWLQKHPGETLLDDRLLYKAVVARGHAHNLVLPFMYKFKNEMRRPYPSLTQVVVSNPAHPNAAYDRVSQQFPSFFRNGSPGYTLVYDDGIWRVWSLAPKNPHAAGLKR